MSTFDPSKPFKKLAQHAATPADKAVQEVRKKIDGMTHLGRLADATPGAVTYPELNDMLDAFASAFTQKNRILTFQIGDGQEYADRILAQHAEGREALSESYAYEVTCLSPDAYLPLDSFLGKAAQIDIATGLAGFDASLLDKGEEPPPENVTRCGVITRADSLPSDGGFARYRLTVESPV
ncbi:MAG: hypothetical protein LBG78_01870, partial [Azoarcus sp.]|nr:hypothetical protein [Azoarcus sp.]